MAIKFYVNLSNAPTSAFVHPAGKPAQPCEIYLGDVLNTSVSSVDSNGIAVSGFDVNQSYAFNISLKSSARVRSYCVGFGGLLTRELPHDAPCADVEDAINALSTIAAVGGVRVEKNGAVYKVIFKQAGARPSLEFVSRNGAYPPSKVLVEGSDTLALEQIFITRFGALASTSDFVATETAISFKLALNTYECALALGSSASVEVVCELIAYSDSARQTLAQSNTTLFNRVIDFDDFAYASNEILLPVERAESAAQRSESALAEIRAIRGKPDALKLPIRNGSGVDDFAYMVLMRGSNGSIYPEILTEDEYEEDI